MWFILCLFSVTDGLWVQQTLLLRANNTFLFTSRPANGPALHRPSSAERLQNVSAHQTVTSRFKQTPLTQTPSQELIHRLWQSAGGRATRRRFWFNQTRVFLLFPFREEKDLLSSQSHSNWSKMHTFINKISILEDWMEYEWVFVSFVLRLSNWVNVFVCCCFSNTFFNNLKAHFWRVVQKSHEIRTTSAQYSFILTINESFTRRLSAKFVARCQLLAVFVYLQGEVNNVCESHSTLDAPVHIHNEERK